VLKDRYVDTLDLCSKKRCIEKIKVIDDEDPYELNKSVFSDNDFDSWPGLNFADLFVYLVVKRSAYTTEKFKAHKSLESYNYFIGGFVQYVGHVIINGNSLFIGKVKGPNSRCSPGLLCRLLGQF
jgi:hypothetical protein